MLKVIDIAELQPGMFVTQVTKQEGVYRVTSAGRIKNSGEISNLIDKGILQIEIDLNKSLHGDSQNNELPLDQVNHHSLNYSQQLEHALKLYEQVKTVHSKLMNRISKGKPADLEAVNAVSQQLMEKVFECDDAINLVTMLSENDQYFIEHSLNCAILIIVFARHLGFDETLMRQLGAGALLMDIGMVKLPLLLTEKLEDFDQAETKKIQKHVRMALKLVSNIDVISDISREVIELHHERLDGSGYPQALMADDIPIYGRIAAIVDVYDALTSSRPYRVAYKPSEALRIMSEELHGLDQELMSQFITCIGAHPIGSLVKLASNKLAIVMRLNKLSPLKPVVMAFYDLDSKQHDTVTQIDLSNVDDAIVGSVDPADPAVNLNQFLHQTLLAH
ncbi:HD domain-containing phosphohydrolase [Paraglaciecola sp.]|uniref:HD-GYP domain-containing protein n=1 Tax=Paraglaciecola sp. TaxID=1920173 RepID=UPI0030F47842